QSARRHQGGVFVLVRTSNQGAGMFQDLVVGQAFQPDVPNKSQAGKPDLRPLYQHVGAAVAAWSRENPGACGLGDVGAVVGATYPAELALLRRQMPEVVFLVPGFGAQGGTADDIRPAFLPDGTGAVVNSSRGVLFPSSKSDDPDWE